MKRGETVLQRFSFNFDLDLVDEIVFTFNNTSRETTTPLLQKRYPSDCTLTDNVIYVPLSQEETNLFNGKTYIEPQITFKSGAVRKGETVIKYFNPTLFTKLSNTVSNITDELREKIIKMNLETVNVVAFLNDVDFVRVGDFETTIATLDNKYKNWIFKGVKTLEEMNSMHPSDCPGCAYFMTDSSFMNGGILICSDGANWIEGFCSTKEFNVDEGVPPSAAAIKTYVDNAIQQALANL